jgi:peptidoglycan LD-endopeptidase LytH
MKTGAHRRNMTTTSSRRKPFVVALALVAPLLGALSAPIAGSADPRDAVRAAESRLQQIARDLRDQQREMDRLQTSLDRAATRLAEAEYAYEQTTDRLEQVQAQIGRTARRFEALKEQLDERARAALMLPGGTGLSVVLGATSVDDLSDRMEFLDHIAQSNSDLATDVANEGARLSFERQELKSLQARQQQLLEEAQRQRDLLARQFEAARAAQDRLEELQAQAREILADKKRAFEEWKEAQAAPPPTPAPAATDGDTGGATGPGPFQACPVPGGAISNSFGAPRTGHLHMGVDIFAPIGARILAPFDGVAQNSNNGIGGVAVSVTSSHGAGYVYNAHLSDIGRLGPVQAGDVIGYVGTSGNAAGTSPHNHFEWHPASPPSGVPESPYGYDVISGAVNPYPYLAAVC